MEDNKVEQYMDVVKPEYQGDKNPNTKIIKFGAKITDVLDHKLHGVTSNDPEYWGLRGVVTDEMAEIGLTMKVRHHYTFDQLCKMNKAKTAEEKAKLQKNLDEMAYIGILEYDYGYHYDHNGRTAPQSERRYLLPMYVPGSAELLNMEEDPVTGENKRLKDHPEVASFFERMTYVPLAGITQLVPEGGAGVGMKVIPVEKAISMNNESIDIEKLSYWLKKYEGHIGVGQCSCRVSRKAIGEGCADDASGWCIGVGDFADYCRETNKGHDITVEQALEIFKRAEDNGFVHQITNIDGENKIFGICNCNINICNALRTSQLFNTPNLSRSAYTARVETKNCVACGKCVEYCPAGAVKLGQKLCTKNGPVSYPKHELPDNMSWGEDKWDKNYRDNNRINCYDTGTAPCKTACPAHIAVQGYLKMANQGRYTEALALIKKDNPFPAVCGHICNKRCEDACTRATLDQAVAIDAVKKFIAERDLKAETRYIPPVIVPASPCGVKPVKNWKQKIAIIGGGPAGLTCAYYLATKGYLPTVFEKNKKAGGMLVYGIPSYKLEKDVVQAEIDVLTELGVEIKCGVEVGKDVTLKELRKQGYEAFFISIGCQGGRRPGVANDNAEGTTIAVDFLHDASENKKTVIEGDTVVVGGGNVAVDCARTAKRFKSANVSMWCLESRETMPASKDEQAETLEEGISINNGWGPKEVLVDENGAVSGIVFKKCLRTIDPETKRFSPLYDENETVTVPCKKIVFAIGQAIEWGKMLEGEAVEFWRGNYPVADPVTFQTAQKDIFVGGDVYSGPKFAIDAIANGKAAAEVLHRYVQNASLTIGLNRRNFVALDKENIDLGLTYDNVKGYEFNGAAPRQEAGMEKGDHKMSFKDFHKTLTEEQVKIETSRCLSCGASVVDENKCIGCGVCTTKCEFDAIHLFRTHPKCATMIPSEDKFKKILPYAIKRGLKIKFGKHTAAEKASEKKHKEFVKAQKKAAKASK